MNVCEIKQMFVVEMMSGMRKKKKERKKERNYKYHNMNRSQKLKYNKKMQNKTY